MNRTWEGGRGKEDVYPLALIRGRLLLPCLSPSGIFLSWVQIKQLSASWTSRPWDGERSLFHQPYGVHYPHVHPAKVSYAQPANHPSAQSVGVPLLPHGAPTIQPPAEPLALL